jgi:hypothetical protein
VSDRLVEDASEQGVELLPIVADTPVWARTRIKHWWPERTSDFAKYIRALVERYGPDGQFWDARPDVPERPLRHWQIYNEPGMSGHYAPVLRAAHRQVKNADPGAKIVLAGLTGTNEGCATSTAAAASRSVGSTSPRSTCTPGRRRTSTTASACSGA